MLSASLLALWLQTPDTTVRQLEIVGGWVGGGGSRETTWVK